MNASLPTAAWGMYIVNWRVMLGWGYPDLSGYHFILHRESELYGTAFPADMPIGVPWNRQPGTAPPFAPRTGAVFYLQWVFLRPVRAPFFGKTARWDVRHWRSVHR